MGAGELRAQAEMTSYLRAGGYDTAAIFSASGAARNDSLVMFLVDMVLYHIHSRIAPRNIPELREIRYTAAIDWLKALKNGDVDAGLPTLTVGGITQTDFRTGGNVPLQHHY